jgi:hypothetical protein
MAQSADQQHIAGSDLRPVQNAVLQPLDPFEDDVFDGGFVSMRSVYTMSEY